MFSPLKILLLLIWGPWTDIGEQRRDSGLVFGEERHRRWGLGWGKWRGVRAAPVEGLCGGGGARRRPVHGESGAAAALCSGGGVPVAWGGRGGVGELPGGEVKPSGGSVVVEEGCGAPATAS